MTLRITSLMENTAVNERLACEAGMSLFIEFEGKNILVDTGASPGFIENARAMNIDLSKLDYVILTHGHGDHGGGFRALCEKYSNKFQLLISPYFFERKYRRFGDIIRYIGNGFTAQYLQENKIDTVYPMAESYSFTERGFLLSAIPSAIAFEDEPNDFLVFKAGEYARDMFREEVFPVFDLPDGLVVIAGCGHTGVANICEVAKARLGKPVRAVIGGLHLKDSSEDRICQTVSYLRSSGIKLIATGHCNGELAGPMLATAAPEVLPLSSGAVIEFE